MSNSRYKTFHIVTFRGFKFLWNSESAERGKKTVLHEYLNSDKRYIEELGKKPPIYTIEALLTGKDVQNQRFKFETILEKPGIGRLVHPLYGELNVTVLDYVVSSTQTRLGEVRFSIKFAQTLPKSPEPVEITKNSVTRQGIAVRDELDEGLLETWIEPTGFIEIKSAAEQLKETWQDIQAKVNDVVNLTTAAAATFNRVVKQAQDEVFGLATDVENLADSFRSIIDTALAAAEFPQDLKDVWRSLAEISIFPERIPPSQIDRQKAQSDATIKEYLRINALANSYEAAVYGEFATEIEFESTKSFLSESLIDFLHNAEYDFALYGLKTITESNAIQNSLNYLQSLSQVLLDQKEQNIYRIKEVDISYLTSLPLLVYKYYKSLDLLETIQELNPDINPANFTGKIKLLTL